MNEPFSASALAIVGIYTALNTFILVWLSHATGNLRRKHRISIGDGGNKHLTRIMRGHANAIENMPITLLMLAIAALIGTPIFVLHIMGILFTIGRVLHAWHFIQEDASMKSRFAGFGLSFIVSAILAFGLLAHGLVQAFGG
ncbi:MAG: glutathione S-transferase [Hyphomicrobiales bacterium]|nr:MAG: glutathione S-transferase [Hyphomicrobiales bacterium]